MRGKIKLFEPIIGKEESKKIIQVLKSGFWASGSGIGNVKSFEDKFQNYIGSKSCVAVNSGTAALHLALSLSDIKGKEVILPSLSFVSTAHSIVYNGGKPIFVDIDPKTLCIDPEKVLEKISNKTKIILPVHFAGIPANLKKLKKISKDHNLILIDDAAHACGASYEGKKIGSINEFSCFSFHPVKNLAMPTGGLISLNHKNSKKYKKILESKRWCGITNRKGVKYDVKEIGWNYYMNEFSAAIGLIQLKKLDKMNKNREKISKIYHKEINLNNKMPIENGSSYHFYWIRVKNRNKFMREMKNVGIETGIHYRPIHKLSLYKQKKKLSVTENVENEIVSIPNHPNLKINDIEFIIKNINKFS
jgi:perosamine synthetase